MFSFLYHCQDFFRTKLLVVSVLLIVLVFCVVLLCIFTFWVPCCDVRYDFRIETMFSSSLPSVVWRRAHVLFTLFVFACVKLCFCFVCPRLFSCAHVVASFSGLSIFDWPFSILWCLFNYIGQTYIVISRNTNVNGGNQIII